MSTAEYRAFDMRTPGSEGTGTGSGHASVHEPWILLEHGIVAKLSDTVPTKGTIHLGETNPYNGGLIQHTKEVINYLLGSRP
jgi:hypothetical protein